MAGDFPKRITLWKKTCTVVQNCSNLLETLATQACQNSDYCLSTGLFTGFVDNFFGRPAWGRWGNALICGNLAYNAAFLADKMLTTFFPEFFPE
ncbi:hypothetical protein EJD96_09535 [Herbaspirillum seropedicae]|uniref:hypothetical protein n=1 Tax=Herbaspirillum seropedicae TaxID=964 RepID=UPI00111D553E|nr:hypothetical protein [Herbaspirillum seropedicae]QDD64388.1 hypothetical protein EJD96_09535 [Herbaspirillum seropedicae]